MRTRVKFIKPTDNTTVGTEKLLQPFIARDLAKRGFVEILGEGIAPKRVTSKVDKVDVNVEEIDLTADESFKALGIALEDAVDTIAEAGKTDGPVDYTTLSFAELRQECEALGLPIMANPSKVKLIALLSNR